MACPTLPDPAAMTDPLRRVVDSVRWACVRKAIGPGPRASPQSGADLFCAKRACVGRGASSPYQVTLLRPDFLLEVSDEVR